jgi:hypothetical protein
VGGFKRVRVKVVIRKKNKNKNSNKPNLENLDSKNMQPEI